MRYKVGDIVKLLDLNIEEEFYIYDNYNKKKCNFIYKFSHNSLLYFESGVWSSSDICILDFFLGRYIIIKKSWKPKYGDKYYYIGSFINNQPIIYCDVWTGCVLDLSLFYSKNIFKTKGMAKAEANKGNLINDLKFNYESAK